MPGCQLRTRANTPTTSYARDLQRFAGSHGYDVHQEYVEGESGGTANRREFKHLFTNAHRRLFDTVLFWSLDRFSREGALPTLKHLETLESYGVGFKSYTKQNLDSTGIFKEAIISILASLAKRERARLSERTRAGLERVRAKGTKLGPPEKSPEVIDQVRRLRASGASNQVIARALKMSPGTVAKYLAQ